MFFSLFVTPGFDFHSLFYLSPLSFPPPIRQLILRLRCECTTGSVYVCTGLESGNDYTNKKAAVPTIATVVDRQAGSGSVPLAWLIKTRAAYSRGIECWLTWSTREAKTLCARLSGFPFGGAAQFVGREKGFPNFLGRFSGTEENPLYPCDRRNPRPAVAILFFSFFLKLRAHQRSTRAATQMTY